MNPLHSDAAKQLGIDNLPQEAQEEILTKLGENILKRVLIEMMDRIPEDARDAFAEASKAADEAKVKEMLQTHIPDYDNFVQAIAKEEIEEFKKLVADAQ